MSNTDWIANEIYNASALDESKFIVATESKTDVDAMSKIDGLHVIAFDAKRSKAVANYLRDHYPDVKIVLLFDNDEVGTAHANQTAQALKQAGIMVYSNPAASDAAYTGMRNAAAAIKDMGDGMFASVIDPVLSQAKQELDEIETQKVKGAFITGEELIEQRRIDAESEKRGTPTGFKRLDRALGNGLPNKLVIIGAPPSLGKTTFALQIADNIAAYGRNVLYYALEMSVGEMVNKSISRMSYAGLPNGLPCPAGKAISEFDAITGRKWSKDGMIDVTRHIADLEKAYSETIAKNMYVMHPLNGILLHEIRTAARRFADWKGSAPVIVVDYIQIVKRDDVRMSDKQAADEVVKQLQYMALELKTPVIGISSLNRASYQERVSMDAFKESGGIEYSAGVAIGLQLYGAGTFIGTGKYRRGIDVEHEKKCRPRRMQAIILKSRRGQVGDILPFDYPAAYNTFQEISDVMYDPDTGTSRTWEKPKYKETKAEGGADGENPEIDITEPVTID